MTEPKVLSDKNANIASFIDGQPTEFASVDVVTRHHDLFELPDYAKKEEKKFGFRWVSSDTRMLEKSRTRGWLICNRTNASFIPNTAYGLHGAVERYGHLLAFRPIELSEAYKKRVQQQSIDQIKVATKEDEKDHKDSPFYTAKLSKKEEESEEGGSGQIVQGSEAFPEE